VVVRLFRTSLDPFKKQKPERKIFVMTHDQSEAVGVGLGLIALLVILVIALALYLFSSFCFKRICEKCGVTPGVLVWIPIARLVPLLEVAKMPVWMIILFLIP